MSPVRTSHSFYLSVLNRLLSSTHLNESSHRETYESAHSAIWQFHCTAGIDYSGREQGTGVARPMFGQLTCCSLIIPPSSSLTRIYSMDETFKSPSLDIRSLAITIQVHEAKMHPLRTTITDHRHGRDCPRRANLRGVTRGDEVTRYAFFYRVSCRS